MRDEPARSHGLDTAHLKTPFKPLSPKAFILPKPLTRLEAQSKQPTPTPPQTHATHPAIFAPFFFGLGFLRFAFHFTPLRLR